MGRSILEVAETCRRPVQSRSSHDSSSFVEGKLSAPRQSFRVEVVHQISWQIRDEPNQSPRLAYPAA
jgi:hypothetical protein